jgi:hypothetical protein
VSAGLAVDSGEAVHRGRGHDALSSVVIKPAVVPGIAAHSARATGDTGSGLLTQAV